MQMQNDNDQIPVGTRFFIEFFDVQFFCFLLANGAAIVVLLYCMSFEMLHNYAKWVLLLDGGAFQIYLFLGKGRVRSLKYHVFYILCNEPLLLIVAYLTLLIYLHRLHS